MENESSCICGAEALSGSTARGKPRTTVSRNISRALTTAYLYGSHIGEGSLTQYIGGVFQDDVERQVTAPQADC